MSALVSAAGCNAAGVGARCAVSAGAEGALVTDAVAGVPEDYAEAVIQHSLRLLATCITTDQVVDAWA